MDKSNTILYSNNHNNIFDEDQLHLIPLVKKEEEKYINYDTIVNIQQTKQIVKNYDFNKKRKTFLIVFLCITALSYLAYFGLFRNDIDKMKEATTGVLWYVYIGYIASIIGLFAGPAGFITSLIIPTPHETKECIVLTTNDNIYTIVVDYAHNFKEIVAKLKEKCVNANIAGTLL